MIGGPGARGVGLGAVEPGEPAGGQRPRVHRPLARPGGVLQRGTGSRSTDCDCRIAAGLVSGGQVSAAAAGAAVAPLGAAMDTDVAEPGLPACGAVGVVAELGPAGPSAVLTGQG